MRAFLRDTIEDKDGSEDDRKHRRDASYDEKKNGRNHTALAAALSALAVAAASAHTDAALAGVSVSDKKRCEDLYAIAKSKADVDSACEYVNKQMEEEAFSLLRSRAKKGTDAPPVQAEPDNFTTQAGLAGLTGTVLGFLVGRVDTDEAERALKEEKKTSAFLESQLKKRQGEWEELQGALETETASKQTALEKAKKAEASLEEARAEYARSQEQAEKAIDEVRAESARKEQQLKASIKEIQALLDAATRKAEEAASESTMLRGELKATNADLSKLQGEFASLEAAKEAAEKTIAKLEGELDDTKKSLASVEGELKGTKSTLADTKKSLTSVEGELADTKKSLASVEGELADTKKSLASVEAAKATLEMTNAALQEQLSGEEELRREATSVAEAAAADVTRLQNELKDALVALSNMEETLTMLTPQEMDAATVQSLDELETILFEKLSEKALTIITAERMYRARVSGVENVSSTKEDELNDWNGAAARVKDILKKDKEERKAFVGEMLSDLGDLLKKVSVHDLPEEITLLYAEVSQLSATLLSTKRMDTKT